jgi:hypothetical protein
MQRMVETRIAEMAEDQKLKQVRQRHMGPTPRLYESSGFFNFDGAQSVCTVKAYGASRR